MSKGLFGIFLKQGVGRNENDHKALTGVILGNFLGLFPGNINFFIFSFSLRTLQKNRFLFFFLISSDVPLFEIFFFLFEIHNSENAFQRLNQTYPNKLYAMKPNALWKQKQH